MFVSNTLPLSALALAFSAAISGSACSSSSSSSPETSAGATTGECTPSSNAPAKTSAAALCTAGAAATTSSASGGGGSPANGKTSGSAGSPGSAAATDAGTPHMPTAGAAGQAGATASAGSAGNATSSAGAGRSGSAGTPPDQPTAGGPAANGCNATLCEDFESGTTLDASRWQTVMPMCSGTGKLALDSTQAHSGKNSVRIDGAGGFCNHVFLSPVMSLFPASDPLFVRFYVRISTALTQSHVSWLAMRDEHDMNDLRMGGQSEILMWNRASDDATLPELSPTGIAMSAKPATNTWMCVEFSIDGAKGELHTWLDGTALAGLTVEGDPTPDVDSQWKRKTDWHPQLSDLRLGWESYGNDANTLWFDDVAIGSSRVGCAP